MYKLKKQLLLILIVSLSLPVISYADMPEFFDQPKSGYTSNVVTDIISHDGSIWFATDEGLNFSIDGGETWFLYDNTNGLVSSSISAFFSIPSPLGGQRIWAATNHVENIVGSNTAISDGVSYSDDQGLTWNQVDFETAPNDIPFVWGGDRTVFDITGHYDPFNESFDNWIFFTAFAGGFLASQDGGQTFRRIFPSTADSIQFYTPDSQPSLRNRYFSCVADTSHGDSLFVWAGTAGGLFQYVYVEPKDKAFVKHVNAIELCSNCPADDSSFVYYGGLEGFTRGNKFNGQVLSRFEADGLPGGQITAMLDFGGKLFVGTAVSADDNTSRGLAISTDFGESFTAYNEPAFEGTGHTISDFAVINNNRIYMALEENGLYVSNDTGLTWQFVIVDPSDTSPSNRRNVVHALEAVGDTLNLGTDSGLVRLYISPSGTVDSSLHFVFAENSLSSTRVINLHTQNLNGGGTRLWTVNVPLDTILNLSTPIVSSSDDGGLTFPLQFNLNAFTTDVGFVGDTTIYIGDYGAMFNNNGALPSQVFPIYEKVITAINIDSLGTDTTFVIVDSLHADSLSALMIKGDTILIGGNNGFALSVNRGESFNITRINTDSLAADFVLNISSAISGIDGDWFPGLGIQYKTNDPFARVWASVRPTFSGTQGISIGIAAPVIDTLTLDTVRFERIWGVVHDKFAWNFAFASDTVFASTNNGLIYAHSDSLVSGSVGYDWTTVEMVDSLGVQLLLEGTPVYAVEVDDNYVWIGTADRSIRLNRSDLSVARAFYVIDSLDEVYAFPIPYSHVNSKALDFHFVVKQQADITIEIYDFAMHLVKRVVDNVTYPPGVYPKAGTERRIWDGLNGKGDEVSVGMYYFKISYSTGDTRWGKIAVIP